MKKFILGVIFSLITFTVNADYAPYIINCNGELRCDVYLSDSIENSEKYIELYKLINTAPSNSVIFMHLSGYGGHMDTVLRLANCYEHTNAKIISIVEGPVMSAHGFIAMLANNIVIADHSIFLFHLPAYQKIDKNGKLIGNPELYREFCRKQKGTDRGINNVQKCLGVSKQMDIVYQNLFNKYVYPYMTKKEREKMLKGYDVIIQGNEMRKRHK